MREVTFGMEDSFVSTVGAITGMAVGAQNRSMVILAGLIIIVVEATSMAAGSYLSSKASADANHRTTSSPSGARPLIGGVTMLFSYVIAGFFPLLPYLLLPLDFAVEVSIFLTLVMLFLVGAWQTKYTGRKWWKSAFEMFLVGGTAIVIGIVVGRLASSVLGITVL